MSNTRQCLIRDEWRGTTVILTCSGAVDLLTAPQLQLRIDEVLALVPTELIVDLTLVDFISSRGMYVLLKSHDQCSPSSRLIVIAEGPTTLRPMRVMGLTEILDIRTRLDDALADVHANR